MSGGTPPGGVAPAVDRTEGTRARSWPAGVAAAAAAASGGCQRRAPLQQLAPTADGFVGDLHGSGDHDGLLRATTTISVDDAKALENS
jgi:hypothetical protein